MRYEMVYKILHDICSKQLIDDGKVQGVTAAQVSKVLHMHRSNVVREFTKLMEEGLIDKTDGRPVYYYIKDLHRGKKSDLKIENSIFDIIIGKQRSLKNQISLAKAAIVYPPKGLHTLIVGETGVGKSYFAKCMFKYAKEIGKVKKDKNLVIFNCADYANNPQLLISHLFGVKKGTYTGADEDKKGIIEKARDGMIFLDEVHRLSPEGQEMLFTLIDEGKYTPLGSTKEVSINLMIICATTENVNSALLKTFTRRIPVVIQLPPLQERSSEERLDLIKYFFKEESKRIVKKIIVEKEAINALLNYECVNNIGQLKSDIQIACAKAFLRSILNHNLVEVKIEDFSDEVKSGLLMAKKITKVKNTIEIDDENNLCNEEDTEDEDKYNLSKDIYEFIEKRTEILQSRGVEKENIRNKLSSEIQNFINIYLSNIKNYNGEDEIKKIINEELYDFLREFMYVAEYNLKRKISRNTFLGLLIHIDTFLGRIKENRVIENPKLDETRKNYPEEFKLAMTLAYKLEKKYNITVPMDEIGFIAMFFAADIKEVKGKVAVIVAMHGNSTATSMVEVANQLLNTSHAVAFDMPLWMKPENALQDIEELVKKHDEGKGVILLVDMGSLKFFDKIIKEDTAINVQAVEMITTATIIEATRKALINNSLEDIVKSVNLESRFLGAFLDENIKSKKDVIITACSTGEGTANKLKELVNEKYGKDTFEVINLSMKDEEKFKKAVLSIKERANVKCIISPFRINIENIKYLPLSDFIKDEVDKLLNSKINLSFIEDMKKVYKEYLDLNNANYLVENFIEIICCMKTKHSIHINSEKFNGLLMHFGCLIQKIKSCDQTPNCNSLELIKSRYGEIFNFLKNSFKNIETLENIKFRDKDIGNIVEILINI